jgi:hypothetical protein
MRGCVLAALVATAGCLYTGELNYAPSLQLDPPSVASTIKGSPITVHASMSDDSDSVFELASHLKFTVFTTETPPTRLGACDVDQRPWGGETGTFKFYRTGTFSISAITEDHQHAKSNTATVIVTITDAPPVFVPANAAPKPTGARNACDYYTAGDVITVGFTDRTQDDDAQVSAPGCDSTETIHYQYKVTAMPAGAQPVLTIFDNTNNCKAPDASSGTTLAIDALSRQVCLWTDNGSAFASEMYAVQLIVDDGTSFVPSKEVDIPVAPDQPPCITGEYPAATTSSYIVDRTQVQTFEVTGVFDDRDPYNSTNLTYIWSVRRSSDLGANNMPVWRDVPMHSEPTYALDTSQFLVGEVVNVRVVAIDRTGQRPMCPDAPDPCQVTSCQAGGAICYQGKTWTLELR